MLEWLVSVIAELRSNDEAQLGVAVPAVLAAPVGPRELIGATNTVQATSSSRAINAHATAVTLNQPIPRIPAASGMYHPPPLVPSPTEAALTLHINASAPGTSHSSNNFGVTEEWVGHSKECATPPLSRRQGNGDLVPSPDQMLEQLQLRQQQGRHEASNITTPRAHLGGIEETRPVEDLLGEPQEGSTWSNNSTQDLHREPSATSSGFYGNAMNLCAQGANFWHRSISARGDGTLGPARGSPQIARGATIGGAASGSRNFPVTPPRPLKPLPQNAEANAQIDNMRFM